MIASRIVSLAAATTPDISAADTVSVAAAAGFDGAGIWFDRTDWTDATTREVSARLDSTGVIPLDVEPVLLGPAGDAGDKIIDIALAVGARHVLVASRWPDRAATIDRFGDLCDRAAGGDLRVVLEFLPIFVVQTLADALDVVIAAGRSNGGVLVDTLHLARSGGSPDDLAVVDPKLMPYLQLADAPIDMPAPDQLYREASDGRLLPGDGGLPLGRVLKAVPHVPVSVELRSKALRAQYPDPVKRAEVVLAATERVMLGHSG